MKPKFFSKLFVKLFLCHLFIIAFVGTFFLFFALKTVRPHYLETATEHLQELAALQAESILPLLLNENWPELNAKIQNQSRKINKRITIIHNDGTVLADSEEDASQMDNHLNRSEVLAASETGMGASLRFSNTVQKEMLYVAIPVVHENQILAYVRISFSLGKIQALLNRLKSEIRQIALVGILFALPLAAFFSSRITRPIRQLANYARRIAQGDWEAKIFDDYKDEMRELAASFNFMVSQVRSLIQELHHRKDSLQAILASIPEALFVMNSEEKIIIQNEQFSKIKKDFWKANGEEEEPFYWQIIREPALNRLITKVLKNKEKRNQCHVEFEGRYWILTAVSMADNPDFAFIFLLRTSRKSKMLNSFGAIWQPTFPTSCARR